MPFQCLGLQERHSCLQSKRLNFFKGARDKKVGGGKPYKISCVYKKFRKCQIREKKKGKKRLVNSRRENPGTDRGLGKRGKYPAGIPSEIVSKHFKTKIGSHIKDFSSLDKITFPSSNHFRQR